MDNFEDTGELFTLRNQFFTGQYTLVKDHALEEFSEQTQPKVLEYQIRSSIALGQDASKLIDLLNSKLPEGENQEIYLPLSAWNDMMCFGTDNSTYFESLKEPKNVLQAILTGLYYFHAEHSIDRAIECLNNFVEKSSLITFDELEPLLWLAQLYLLKENYLAANKVLLKFDSLQSSTKDVVIYQVLESWMMSLRGKTENLSNSFYFYDEILSTGAEADPFAKTKILSIMFVLYLQMRHFPEAQETLGQIEALCTKPDATLISNKITLDIIVNKGQNVSDLLGQLSKVSPDHPHLKGRAEKNAAFEEIVSKYKLST